MMSWTKLLAFWSEEQETGDNNLLYRETEDAKVEAEETEKEAEEPEGRTEEFEGGQEGEDVGHPARDNVLFEVARNSL